MPTTTKLSLRERKYAQTKLRIMQVAVEILVIKPFEAIAIKELCEQAEVSEATFFNYFPRKTDILVYFIQLWTIQVSWHARNVTKDKGGLVAIEAIFDFTAQESARHPALTSEIIAFQARMRDLPVLHNISLAERVLAFPELTDLEGLPAQGIDSILPTQVKLAIEQGELPIDTDVELVKLTLISIFMGAPLVMFRIDPQQVSKLYQQQLHLLWSGIRANSVHMEQ